MEWVHSRRVYWLLRLEYVRDSKGLLVVTHRENIYVYIIYILAGRKFVTAPSRYDFEQATRKIPKFLQIILWESLGSDVHARPTLQDMLCSFERCLPSSLL